MITFKQYFSESNDNPTDAELEAEAAQDHDDMMEDSEIRKLLLRDCAPFMKACKRGGFLYRGIKNIDEADPFLVDDNGLDEIPVFKKAVRTDRRPLNTRGDVQTLYDRWFEKKFGYKARSESMFCFPEEQKQAARQYGQVCMVFPIGEFQYVWSPKVIDLQMYATDRLFYAHEKDVNDMLDKAGYKKTGLQSALGGNSEILVKCAAYYAIPYEFRHDIHELVM